MSIWQEHNIEEKIVHILRQVQSHDPEHHFGRPFLTAYQLAIAFANEYPDATEAIGWPIGGAGVGQHNSLAQYLALELSRHIKADPTFPVEGAFLSDNSLKDISFKHETGPIHSSLADSGYALSMFRFKEPRGQ
jgi:hypothetical protein